MTDEVKKVPDEESKETNPAETVADTTKKDETVGNALNTKKEAKMVPEAVLIEYKKENKQIAKELKDLKEFIESGATKKEISMDLKELADKHNVDADFLNEFASAVQKKAQADTEEKLNSKIRPIEEKENAKKRDEIFDKHFDKTLEDMPEFKGIVNKDVIKALALDPQNENKTFTQIFNDSYGHLITGKKTLESTKPRGGAEDVAIDFNKASTNPEYFKEIMADPELKRKYNEDIATRNRF